mgnify:CR=1 FL=1
MQDIDADVKIASLAILNECMILASYVGRMALINAMDHVMDIYDAVMFPLTYQKHNAARDAWHAEIDVSGYPCDICGENTTQDEISIAAISNTKHMMHMCPPCGRSYYAKFYPGGSDFLE